MRQRFLAFLLLQILVIVAVTMSFKVISDRQIAATVAGVLFVMTPISMMLIEYRAAKLKNSVWFLAVLQFWVLFALPILGMRLFNWGTEFSQLSFMGFPGPQMHGWSSKSYTLMLIATAWFFIKTFLPVRKS